MRSWFWARWLVMAFAAAVLVWPVVVGYTLLAGERGAAHVIECHERPTSRSGLLTCTGTWRADGGQAGAGKIYGLSAEDAGHSVRVRLGPGGTWAEGSGVPASVGIPIGMAVFTVALVVWISTRLSPLARSLRKGAANGATVLTVSRKKVFAADGSLCASRHPVPPPPFADVPAAYLDQPKFIEVRARNGQALFFIKDWRDHRLERELTVLDRDGGVQATFRRLPPWKKPKPREVLGARYDLESAGGLRLGAIRQHPARKGSQTLAFVILDENEQRLVEAAPGGRRWVVNLDAAAPEAVRNSAIALLLSGYDLP
jgi:hypothetical protein